jgi:hypothetical protein
VALIIPWAAIAVGVPVGITVGGYMLYGSYTWGQVSYRVDQLEKEQAAQAIEALKVQLANQIQQDEFKIQMHEQRLTWIANYLQSHPWASSVAPSLKTSIQPDMFPAVEKTP